MTQREYSKTLVFLQSDCISALLTRQEERLQELCFSPSQGSIHQGVLPELLEGSIWRLFQLPKSVPKKSRSHLEAYCLLHDAEVSRFPRWGPRGQGCQVFRDQGVRAHKTLDLLQSAIGVVKIEVQISRAPYIAGKREASDVLLPRWSTWSTVADTF